MPAIPRSPGLSLKSVRQPARARSAGWAGDYTAHFLTPGLTPNWMAPWVTAAHGGLRDMAN
jgi:hypothetical protein